MTESETRAERSFVLLFRLLMAWTFLYAASHQGIFNPKFSAAEFLGGTKTFHDVYAVLATPAADPVLTFLVSYGHLLIGLSLLVGLMGAPERGMRDRASAHVLDGSHGLAVHREQEQFHRRLSHRLCGCVRLSDLQACRPRLGARWLGRETSFRAAARSAAATGRVGLRSCRYGGGYGGRRHGIANVDGAVSACRAD